MNAHARWLIGTTLAALAGSAAAAPPTAAFLKPSKYAAAIGESVAVHLEAGDAKATKPAAWPATGVDRLVIRGGPDQENRHQVRPDRAGEDTVAVRIDHPDVTVIGTDQKPVDLELTGDELRDFAAKSLAAALAADRLPPADAKITVRQIAHTKTLVRVPPAEGEPVPSALVTTKMGQVVELRPLVDPTAATPGSDVPLWLYVDHNKKKGVKVQATHVPTGRTTEFVTDGGGSGRFRITDAGEWRVVAHDLVRTERDGKTQWTLYTATLTFEAPKGAAQ